MIQTPKTGRRFCLNPSIIVRFLCLSVLTAAGLFLLSGCSSPEQEAQPPIETESSADATPAPPKGPVRPALPSDPEPVTTVSPDEPVVEEATAIPEPVPEDERAAKSAAARKALEEAQSAGAVVLAPGLLAQGEESLSQAEALFDAGKAEEAVAKCAEAEAFFSEARQAAEKKSAEAEGDLIERSRLAVEPLVSAPVKQEAGSETEVIQDAGTEPGESGPSASPVVVVAEPVESVSETAPAPEDEKVPEPEEAAAAEAPRVSREALLQTKRQAEAARDQATTKRVLQVAQTTLEAASKHMADAAEKEASAPDEAKASYELAAQLYSEALQKAESMTQADQAAAQAREAALEMRTQVTEEVRSLAQNEVVAGDTAWKAAEDAGDAPEQAKALYDLAAGEYAKALRVAAERASEPEETSAKVQENLDAARERALKAQGAVTAEIRQYAQQHVAEADALWELATQTAEHDPAKATELFEQARGKYEAAAPAAKSAKRQEFVTKLRERGITVSPEGGGDYTTIGEAIDAVPPDTPIFVKPGVYKEAVVIDKPIALIGDGTVSEIRIESTDADCITIKTPQAVVHGLTLRSSSSFEGKGVYTVYCAEGRLLIEYCDIATDSLSAVAVTGANTFPTIRGCNIHDSTQAGIFFYEDAQGIVENCEIAGNGLAGIQIKSGANPAVRQCKIRQSKGSGIFVNENGRGIIESCDISQNALAGISIASGGNPTVRDCTIVNNRRYGVRAYEGGRGTVETCALSDNEPENWLIGEDCDVTRLDNKE